MLNRRQVTRTPGIINRDPEAKGAGSISFGPSPLIDLLHQAPTPLVILSGPEHRIHLINSFCIRLMRRASEGSVLGKSIREALPELEGQGFFELLDGVYRTGVAYLGSEVPGSIRREDTGVLEDVYFDFTYQPIRGRASGVEGVMVQATDVTEHVRAKQEFKRREQAVQAQWAELQVLYGSAGSDIWPEDHSANAHGEQTIVPGMAAGVVPSCRIMSAERVAGDIVVTFDDGKCALYSASLLRQAFPQAEELF